MNINSIDSLFSTEYGRELLVKNPDFVQAVWENPSCREKWLRKDLKKIHHGQDIYIEKSGIDEVELRKYERMEEILKDHNCQHVRIAKPYFFKQHNSTYLSDNRRSGIMCAQKLPVGCGIMSAKTIAPVVAVTSCHQSIDGRFLTDDKLLIEYLPNEYHFGVMACNDVEANEGAKDEVWGIITLGFAMDFHVDLNGDLVILDPHC